MPFPKDLALHTAERIVRFGGLTMSSEEAIDCYKPDTFLYLSKRINLLTEINK